ncbi:MAG: hypothetical protein RR254_08860 [Muribaculaceae bacterium]
MALTAKEEEQIKILLVAFENGKRLNELPSAISTNPFDLITEVMDIDGESKQAKLATMLPYIEDQCSYGVRIDLTTSQLIRIGNMELHRTLPLHNRMLGCLVNNDGTVNEYLTPNNWSAHDLSGASGQVCVEIPDLYFSNKVIGNYQEVRFSEFPLPGYLKVDRFYYGAYEGAVDRTNNMLCSIMNATAQFRGGSNQANLDGGFNSQLGMPATAMSLTSSRTLANARGTAWQIEDIFHYSILCWLFYVEYGTLNSQLPVNAQLDANSYHMGGLGDGVVSVAKWVDFGYYPVVRCGATNSLGNGTGEVPITIINMDGTTQIAKQCRYRGIESIFGHIHKWKDGVLLDAGTEVTKAYICRDKAKYADTITADYEMVGLLPRTEGYVKNMVTSKYGVLLPQSIGGGSTTGFGDYFYTNATTSQGVRGCMFGGNAYCGAYAGLGYAYAYYAPSNSRANFGSRLLCFQR